MDSADDVSSSRIPRKVMEYCFIISMLLFVPPEIRGPYITRNASGEALEVLQYIENLSLNEIINVTPSRWFQSEYYFMGRY